MGIYISLSNSDTPCPILLLPSLITIHQSERSSTIVASTLRSTGSYQVPTFFLVARRNHGLLWWLSPSVNRQYLGSSRSIPHLRKSMMRYVLARPTMRLILRGSGSILIAFEAKKDDGHAPPSSNRFLVTCHSFCVSETLP